MSINFHIVLMVDPFRVLELIGLIWRFAVCLLNMPLILANIKSEIFAYLSVAERVSSKFLVQMGFIRLGKDLRRVSNNSSSEILP